ncbi:ciliogenesis and planar polarity effector 2-like isoform X2 [Mercenaria mercenaria]|uniref:ciliogenesis and planar polarity effector 2-like isoform X2 n=1 Tax=Mercenaria mercenaria TaxID=6596 RepID=UPI00234EEA91|nr:ciliogenesis and planar polarity effector 2-like isoform X2 [Mercenaria mercenaria]
MLNAGSLISSDWHSTAEGRDMLSCLFTRNKQRLRTFGLLERPPLSAHIEEVRYKILLSGKTGVGKTCTVAKLTGHDIPKTHTETAGIQTSTCYWPVKVSDLNKVMLFRLQLWDTGDGACKKFDHILPACTDKVDAVLFLFSIIDKSSFDELHQQISRLTTPNDNIARIVIATKCDQHAHAEVTQRDIRDFEKTWNIPVLRMKNTVDSSQSDTSDIVHAMNTICEHLWQRDLILAGKISKPVQVQETDTVKKTFTSDEYV